MSFDFVIVQLFQIDHGLPDFVSYTFVQDTVFFPPSSSIFFNFTTVNFGAPEVYSRIGTTIELTTSILFLLHRLRQIRSSEQSLLTASQ